MTPKHRVLKEYVRSVLAEDDFGSGYDFSGMGDSPYGIDFAQTQGGLFKTLVQPFADVISTAKAGVSNVAARFRTLAKVAFEAIATSIIPILSSDFKEIFKKEKEELDKIKEKYRDVFERTDQALFHNDVLAAAFLINPGATTATALMKTAPEAALGIYRTLAGDDKYLKSTLKKIYSQIRSGGFKSDVEASTWSEGVLREERNDPYAALRDPKFVKMINSTPTALSMKKDATAVLNSTVQSLLKRYKEISSARTVEDLSRLFPSVDRSKLKSLQQVPADKRAALEKTIVEQVRASAKKMYAMSLQKRLEQMDALGLTDDNPLVSGYKKVLDMVKSS